VRISNNLQCDARAWDVVPGMLTSGSLYATGGMMLGKCANPSCDVPFRYLRGGKLFLVDLTASNEEINVEGFDRHRLHHSTYFWLCDACSSKMSVAIDREGTAVIQPIGSRAPAATLK